MGEIRSKKNSFFYIFLIMELCIALLCASAIVYIIWGYVIHQPKFLRTPTLNALFIGIGLQAIVKFLRYIRATPNITIDNEKLVMGNKTYLFSDLTNLILFDNYNLESYFPQQTKATSLNFKNPKPIYILDDFYSNISEIKQFLSEHILSKVGNIHATSAINKNIQYYINPTVAYKGSIWYINNIIALITLIIIVVSTTIIDPTDNIRPYMLITMFASLVYYFIMNTKLNYFILSGNNLIVKNLHKKNTVAVYNLADIKEMAFISPKFIDKSVRIVTNDFKNNGYKVNSLSKATIKKMQINMQELNIPVRVQ